MDLAAGEEWDGQHGYMWREHSEAAGTLPGLRCGVTCLIWTLRLPPSISLCEHHLVSVAQGEAFVNHYARMRAKAKKKQPL